MPVTSGAPVSCMNSSMPMWADEPVPPEHFKAVAQVIGYVFRLQGKIKAN